MPTLARPDLPKPACRVVLVCGPPASGKSTYVHLHAHEEDIVIDYDLIAHDMGYGRDRPANKTADLLRERNARLAALSRVSPNTTAYVIVGAPSTPARKWWQEALGVKPEDVILLLPDRRELIRRIVDDPERRPVRSLHIQLVDHWLERDALDR